MSKVKWRGRLMVLCVGCMSLVAGGGCTGLSDQQLSSILQSVLTTGLSTLVSTVVSSMGGG